MKNILYIFLFTFISNSVYSQPSITWQKIYLNNYQQYTYKYLKGTDVCPADSGNFYVVAEGNLPYYGNFNILKLNAYGDTIWTREIDSLTNNICGCCSSGDGGVVCSGEGAFSVKYDKYGNLIWKKKYGFAIYGYKIIRTFDGNFVVCGSYYQDFVIVFKIDSNGNLIWMKQDTNMYYGNYNSVIETNDKNYICVGNKVNLAQDSGFAIVSKFDTSGNIIWNKNYIIKNAAYNFVSIDKIDNNYIIYNIHSNDSIGGQLNQFIKIDELGNINFIKQFDDWGIGWQVYGMDVKRINNNKYLFCSMGFQNQTGRQESKLYLTDSLGNIIIEKTFGDTSIGIDYLKRAYLIGNGDIILEGEYSPNNENYIYSYTIRIDSNLYSPPIGIKKIDRNVPASFQLYQNYPNPFNPSTVIKYQLPITNYVKLVVYNILGEEIKILVNEKQNTGKYSVNFNGTNLSSGIYFYSLIVNNKIIASKKMVVLR